MAGSFADDIRSSSVMDEMAALFAPPGREARNQQKSRVELHPYFKRPGKGHNHDNCDACGEGGDLICCDNCPASFHFSCHAPPLEEEDIPMGDWICLRCYHREQLRLATANANTEMNMVGVKGITKSDAGGDAASEISLEQPVPAAPAATTSGRGRKTKGKGKKQQQAAAAAAEKAEKEKRVKIYRQKYERYLRIKPETNSPFDTLIAASQIMNAEQFELPQEMESKESLPFSWKWADERQDDFDTYPKNCMSCRKTSRGVPTVGCDFCPGVFHLDCLDPPLCEIPKERWMCPNHVENIIDSKMVSSTSMTERMKLWDKHARGPIDQEAVRLEFFRKVRMGKLFQKSNVPKVEKPPDLRIKVPGFVKHHYQNPVQGMPAGDPASGQVFRPETVLCKTESPLDTSPEQDEWLRQLVALQTGILKEKLKDASKIDERGKERLEKLAKMREKERQRKEMKERRRKKQEVARKKEGVTEEAKLVNGKLSPNPEQPEGSKQTESDNESSSSCSTASECGLGLEEEDRISADAQAEICDFIARQKRLNPDVDALDPTIRDFLAMQRVKQLFNASEISKDVPHSTKEPVNDVQARCALIPIDNPRCREPCLVQRRSFEIGLGSSVHLDLSKVGHCNYLSPKHASIFYDQFSRTYELLNYSEHGTIVDNIVYSIEAPAVRRRKPNLIKMSSEILYRKIGSRNCNCAESVGTIASRSEHSCETSAVLHHGSYIRFGCLQFAFSIVDFQPEKVDNCTAYCDLKSMETN